MGHLGYLKGMFYRRRLNASGSYSVQVMEKRDGRNKVVATIGFGRSEEELLLLERQAQDYIDSYGGQTSLSFSGRAGHNLVEQLQSADISGRLIGPELFLGPLYDEIGFNQIEEPLLRHLVIGRICFPGSKLRTARYLSRYLGEPVDVSRIFRLMDRVQNTHQAQAEKISLEHTRQLLGQTPRLVFYDVTTLYFEAAQPDELRISGFSKDGKHQQPQVVLGLLVSEQGYPLAYQMFKGDTYEGGTLLEVLKRFKALLATEQLVVIADSGLLSKTNQQALEEAAEQYILGARIKSLPRLLTEQILRAQYQEGQPKVYQLGLGRRLIISYSEARAKKDAANRTRGLERLAKAVKSGRLTKDNLNKRGYNKFLRLEGEVSVSLDQAKIDQEKLWDGLKGYITTTSLPPKDILTHYGQLWQIEKAFRISKSDLQMRPMYHFVRRRIEAHLCIAFCAYKVYKEAERQLRVKKSDLSVERLIEAIGTIMEIKIDLKQEDVPVITRLIVKDADQQYFLKLFGFGSP